MLYDIQKVERDKWNHPVLRTDLVSSSKRRIFNRAKELNERRQQCRVLDQTGRILNGKEIVELDR